MSGSFHNSRKRKTIIGVAFASCAMASLFCNLERVTAKACNVLDQLGWVALTVLRPGVPVTGSLMGPAYLLGITGLVHGARGILAGLWPLFCFLDRLSVK